MKKIVGIFLILINAFYFQGCVDRDSKNYQTFNSIEEDSYPVGQDSQQDSHPVGQDIYPVGKDTKGKAVFVKGVNIIIGNSLGEDIYQTLYLYCDEDGNLLGNGGISFSEQKGKHSELILVQ